MNVSLWDVDPEDWKIRNSQQITNHVLSHAADGKTVLMHDIYDSSARAAVKIIHELTKQGYQLVTVSELEQLKKKETNRPLCSKHRGFFMTLTTSFFLTMLETSLQAHEKARCLND